MTQFPEDCEVTIAVYHLPTSAGNQAYPASPNATIGGALLPLDRKEHALEGGEYTSPYELYVDADEDVRESDKLLIEADSKTVTFYVKKIFHAPFGGLAHKRLSISTERPPFQP